MFGIFNKNSIPKIARVLPPALIEKYEKQNFYSIGEVRSVLERELKTEHNAEYTFTIFCSHQNFEELNFD